ncbi:MAG TPA: hypothetical protein VLE89_04600 [Chlamydiales bacterium]|nr:hypothetical protein [Chlamydiales bacterium]
MSVQGISGVKTTWQAPPKEPTAEDFRLAAILEAASNGANHELAALIEVDHHRAYAAAYAAPHHMNLAHALIGSADDPIFVHELAIIESALEGREEALKVLIETEYHLAVAIAWLTPKYKDLADRLLADAENQETVSKMATAVAAFDGRQEALDVFIATNEYNRGVAIPWTIPHYKGIANKLFAEAVNPESTREIAIQNAALNGRQEALKMLIQTDAHRALAILYAAPNHMELAATLLNSAANPVRVHELALSMAHLNGWQDLADALAELNKPFAPLQSPRIMG